MSSSIFARRKEIKKRGHKVVKNHYLLLVFLALCMALFGTEFHSSLSGWGKSPLAMMDSARAKNDPGNMLSDKDIISPGEIISDIDQGEISVGSMKADDNAQAIKEKFAGSKALGLTNGVLAQIVNGIMSGQLFTQLAKTIRTITRSEYVAGTIFTIASFVWYALIFFLLKKVYSAVIRRVFLISRVYSHVPLSDVTWFAVVRKWFSACRIMFVTYVYQSLWTLTIIGGVIKSFSYWAVPYITAENPAASPREVITLSRKMMDGHKLELFKFQLTFLGWHLLAFVTSGISNLAYANAYRMAAETEFYALIREKMLLTAPEDCIILNDPCLFKCPDRISLAESYFDVVEEITDIQEKRVSLDGWRRKIVEWFGVWLYSSGIKKAYDEQEERTLAVRHDKLCLKGEAYPQRLSPLWKDRKESRTGQYSFARSYTVWTLLLLFISFCFIGWSWEVALHLMQTGQFANRGTLHGPWLPIYGSGGIIVLVLCARFRKTPVLEFFSAILLCGTLEYVSSWGLERIYHQRWWSYDGYFLNLHGRICAEGLLVFGVGCCVVVYLAAPGIDHMLSKVKQNILIAVCLVLGVIYTSDMLYSRKHPNMSEGAIESAVESRAEDGGRLTEGG